MKKIIQGAFVIALVGLSVPAFAQDPSRTDSGYQQRNDQSGDQQGRNQSRDQRERGQAGDQRDSRVDGQQTGYGYGQSSRQERDSARSDGGHHHRICTWRHHRRVCYRP